MLDYGRRRCDPPACYCYGLLYQFAGFGVTDDVFGVWITNRQFLFLFDNGGAFCLCLFDGVEFATFDFVTIVKTF